MNTIRILHKIRIIIYIEYGYNKILHTVRIDKYAAYGYNSILHRDRINQISKFVDIKLKQNDSDTRNLEVV